MWIATSINNIVQVQYDTNVTGPGSIPAGWTANGVADCIVKQIPLRYCKIANDEMVEMTDEEKAWLDLPSKYKVDGREMTDEEKKAVDDAEAQRQADAQAAMDAAQADSVAAQEEAQANLEVVTPEVIKALRSWVIQIINARFPDQPVTDEEVAAIAAAVSAQIQDSKATQVHVTP